MLFRRLVLVTPVDCLPFALPRCLTHRKEVKFRFGRIIAIFSWRSFHRDANQWDSIKKIRNIRRVNCPTMQHEIDVLVSLNITVLNLEVRLLKRKEKHPVSQHYSKLKGFCLIVLLRKIVLDAVYCLPCALTSRSTSLFLALDY